MVRTITIYGIYYRPRKKRARWQMEVAHGQLGLQKTRKRLRDRYNEKVDVYVHTEQVLMQSTNPAPQFRKWLSKQLTQNTQGTLPDLSRWCR
jgi:hypothetical protein